MRAPVDLAALKSAEAALGQRLDRLEAAEKSISRETADAEARAAIAAIKERLAAIDGQVASQRTAADTMAAGSDPARRQRGEPR